MVHSPRGVARCWPACGVNGSFTRRGGCAELAWRPPRRAQRRRREHGAWGERARAARPEGGTLGLGLGLGLSHLQRGDRLLEERSLVVELRFLAERRERLVAFHG